MVFEKVYAPSYLSANLSLGWKREKSTLSDLDHPNIVKVITWGKWLKRTSLSV
jgi:hypothetical protein